MRRRRAAEGKCGRTKKRRKRSKRRTKKKKEGKQNKARVSDPGRKRRRRRPSAGSNRGKAPALETGQAQAAAAVRGEVTITEREKGGGDAPRQRDVAIEERRSNENPATGEKIPTYRAVAAVARALALSRRSALSVALWAIHCARLPRRRARRAARRRNNDVLFCDTLWTRFAKCSINEMNIYWLFTDSGP